MAYQYLKTAKPVKIEDQKNLSEAVAEIIEKVRIEGDSAVYELTKKFDGIDRKTIKITEEEFVDAEKEISVTLKRRHKILE